MKIVQYVSGKMGMLSNGMDFDIKEYVPKIEVVSSKKTSCWNGLPWISVYLKYGEHRDDYFQKQFQTNDLENVLKLAEQEAKLLYPKIYERSTHKNPSIYGLFYVCSIMEIHINFIYMETK